MDELTVKLVDGEGYTVQQGGRFHPGLTYGEMIEQVTALLPPPPRAPYPMRTAEEWRAASIYSIAMHNDSTKPEGG